LVDVVTEAEIEDQHYLAFENNLFFSYEFLNKALELIKDAKYSIRFCVARNKFNNRFSMPDNASSDQLRKYNFFYRVLTRQ
jgi:hypothetical protein